MVHQLGDAVHSAGDQLGINRDKTPLESLEHSLKDKADKVNDDLFSR